MVGRLVAVMVVVALTMTAADAAVICQKKSGAVVVRPSACKKKETALDLSQFVSVGKAPDSDTLDGIDSTGFLQAGQKAADAETLDGIDASAFLQPEGLILVSASHKEWVAQTGSVVTASYSRNVASFTPPGAAANQFLGIGPALPVALYGRRVELLGVEFCYSASATALIDDVYLTAYDNSTTGFSSTQIAGLNDPPTGRTIRAASTTSPPVDAFRKELIEFSVKVDYSAAAPFYVGRTTFIMNATNTPAVTPRADGGSVVTLAPTASTDRTRANGSSKPGLTSPSSRTARSPTCTPPRIATSDARELAAQDRGAATDAGCSLRDSHRPCGIRVRRSTDLGEPMAVGVRCPPCPWRHLMSPKRCCTRTTRRRSPRRREDRRWNRARRSRRSRCAARTSFASSPPPASTTYAIARGVSSRSSTAPATSTRLLADAYGMYPATNGLGRGSSSRASDGSRTS
jgi:hypothetical protein